MEPSDRVAKTANAELRTLQLSTTNTDSSLSEIKFFG